MEHRPKSLWSRVARRLRQDFLAGILVIVPLAVVIWALSRLFISIDDFMEPVIKFVVGRPVVGIGFAITLPVIYLIGLVTTSLLGKRIIRYGESLLERVSLRRDIYRNPKQLLESLMLVHRSKFKEVVLVEFPRPGMRTIGFVTNRLASASGQELLNVYIPNVPNPMSGFLELVPKDDVMPTNISVEAAMEMVISRGHVSPAVI